MFAIKFPVRDYQVAAKLTPAPSTGHCFRCVNYRKGEFGHTNKELRNYLAFHCDKCQFWYCGFCYSSINASRDLDERCPGKCGTVTSAVQLITREWFPLKNLVLSTTVPQPSQDLQPINPITPTPLLLSVSQTEVSPPNPEDAFLAGLVQVIESLRAENQSLKRKLAEVEESNKKKVETIKLKFIKLLEEQ